MRPSGAVSVEAREWFAKDVFVAQKRRSPAAYAASMAVHAGAVGAVVVAVAVFGPTLSPIVDSPQMVFLAPGMPANIPAAPAPRPQVRRPSTPRPNRPAETPPPSVMPLPQLPFTQVAAGIPDEPPAAVAVPEERELALNLLTTTAQPTAPAAAVAGPGGRRGGPAEAISEEPVTDFDQNAALLTRVDPKVPLGATGDVRAEVLILTTGRVSRVRILDQTPYAALIQDAASQFTFRPARRRGRPVAVIMILTFKLSTLK
jgi:hypothetical protein